MQMFFKAITEYFIFYFMFVKTVQTISVLHLPCVDLMVHSTTGCSLDGWFDLTELVAGTVAPAGTVKRIRFIFLYFLYFTFYILYIDLHFYICFSL